MRNLENRGWNCMAGGSLVGSVPRRGREGRSRRSGKGEPRTSSAISITSVAKLENGRRYFSANPEKEG
jgi:hypothetical protein